MTNIMIMKKRRTLTDEENTEANRLKAIYGQAKRDRKAQGLSLTQEDIAAHFGWSGQTAVSQYMNGNIALNLKSANLFAKYFDVPLNSISPRLANMLPSAALSLIDKAPSSLVSADNVPLISWLQAGSRLEPASLSGSEKWIVCPVPHSSSTFALIVAGQSMHSPGEKLSFEDGDIIHVDPAASEGNGSLVVVRAEGESEAEFKQIIIEHGKRFLRALNPDWPSRIVEMPSSTEVCGVVISKTVSYL